MKKVLVISMLVTLMLLILPCANFYVMAEEEYLFKRGTDGHVVAEESTWGTWGDLGPNTYVSFDLSEVPEGNYRVTYNGSAMSDTENLPMQFKLEVAGNEPIYGMAPWTGRATNNEGNSVKKITEVGIVSVNSASTRLKFTNVKGAIGMGFTIILTRVGDYNLAGSYRINKYTGQVADTTFYEKSTQDNYGIYDNDSMSWNLHVEYDGIYDVIFYGGVQSNNQSDMLFSLSLDEIDIITATAPWTGTSSTNYLFQNYISNIGWETHKFTKVGSVLLNRGDGVLKFTNKASSGVSTGQMSSNYGTLILVRSGDIECLDEPTMVLDGSNAVIDFDKELLSDASNLSKISVTGGNGTAAISVNPSDVSQIIISGVTGNFTVNIAAGFMAAEGMVLQYPYIKSCYIPSCSVTQKALFKYGSNYYAQATFSVPVGVPYVDLFFAFYNDSELVGVHCSTYQLWDGRQISLSVPESTYAGNFTEAKLFVWERGSLVPILVPAYTQNAQAFN